MPIIIQNMGVEDTVLSVDSEDIAKALTDASIPNCSQKAWESSFERMRDQKVVSIKYPKIPISAKADIQPVVVAVCRYKLWALSIKI